MRNRDLAKADLCNSVWEWGDNMPTETINFGNSVQEGVDLAKQLNPIYVNNFKIAMEAVSPGSGQAVAQNIGSMLRGEVPLDLQKQLLQTSAEMNMSQGRFGEAANFSTMRNLGVASNQIQQQGLSNLKSLMPTLPDVASLIASRQQYNLQRASLQNQESQFQRSLAEKQAEFGAMNAIDKLKLSLAQRAQAFNETTTNTQLATDRYKFDTSLAWDQTQSQWNREFEKWSIAEQQKLAQLQMASNERVAAGNAANMMKFYSMQQQANSGLRTPTSVAATPPAGTVQNTGLGTLNATGGGSALGSTQIDSSGAGQKSGLANGTWVRGADGIQRYVPQTFGVLQSDANAGSVAETSGDPALTIGTGAFDYQGFVEAFKQPTDVEQLSMNQLLSLRQ